MATRKIFLALAVICLQTFLSYAERVSDVDCTKGGTDQCTQTPNAECNNAETAAKCQCSNDYKEDNNDGNTCILKSVSDVDCTKGGTDQCKHTPNAECNNAETAAKCKCSTDYKEDDNDGSTCILKRVSDVDCTKDGTDQCKHTPNAECNNADSAAKCQCSDGYKEDNNDGSTCILIIGSTCTGTDTCAGDANTVCENSECICKNGYQDTDNVCKPIPVSETTCTTDEQCAEIFNSACVDTKCACNDGFREETNTCMKVIGSACTETDTDSCTDDTNSACTNNKCTCKNDYEEKENVCTLTVSGTPCSAEGDGCEDIENAICDADAEKCTCSPSFIMDVDTCVSENAAVSVEVKTITMLLSALVTIQGMIR